MKAIYLPQHPNFMNDFCALNLEQKLVYFAYLLGLNIMLTGGGGVGKSHFIRFLKKYHPNVALTASTGIAGVNINGVTMDSYMGFSKKTTTPEQASKIEAFHVMSRLKETETLLIDEGSMLRVDRFEMIDARLRAVKKDPRPFGGVQMIIVGDFMQLAPVLKRDSEEGLRFTKRYGDALFLFESPVYARAQFEPYLLHQYIRNGNPHERRILRNMRMGHNLPEVVDYINRYATGALAGKDSVLICKVNAKVNELNKRELANLPGPVFTYEARVEKQYPSEIFPAERSIALKQGCRVMLTMNSKEPEFKNGDLGTVTQLDSHSITVKLDRNGQDVVVEKNEWVHSEMVLDGQEWVECEKGSFYQLPVRLGYALTVYKTQGLTFNSAIADLSGGFNPDGMTYVLLSRVTSFAGLKLLRKLTIHDIKVNKKAAEFTMMISRQAMERAEERRLAMEIHLKSFGLLCA